MGSARAAVSPVVEALAVEPSEIVAFLRLITPICVVRFDTNRGAILDRRIVPVLLSCGNLRVIEEFPHGLLVEMCFIPEETRDRYTVPLATEDIMVPMFVCYGLMSSRSQQVDVVEP